jgi:hypothetical protein
VRAHAISVAPTDTCTASPTPGIGVGVSIWTRPGTPNAPWPQQSTSPCPPGPRAAQVSLLPDDTLTASSRPGTLRGRSGSPCGSRNPRRRPQHITAPPRSRAQLTPLPAVTSTASAIPATVTGSLWTARSPAPSSPETLLPQQRTVPSRFTAQAWEPSIVYGLLAATCANPSSLKSP